MNIRTSHKLVGVFILLMMPLLSRHRPQHLSQDTQRPQGCRQGHLEPRRSQRHPQPGRGAARDQGLHLLQSRQGGQRCRLQSGVTTDETNNMMKIMRLTR